MSETDEMALTPNSSSSSSRKNNAEIPLTVTNLPIDKSPDFLANLNSEGISLSRSSSISSSSMGSMGNGPSSNNINNNGRNGSQIVRTASTSSQSSITRNHLHHQSSSTESPRKSTGSTGHNNMSPLNQPVCENGKSPGETNEKGDGNSNSSPPEKKSGKEDKMLMRSEAETESENSTSETFFTPSASIHNLSGQLTTTTGTGNTSGIGSESEISGSIHSGGSGDSFLLDDVSLRSFEISPLPSELTGSKTSLELNYNPDGSLTNSINSELTASVDSTISKESTSSSNNSQQSNLSHGKVEGLQPGVYNTKLPTKKRMWYHVFQPSYKTRSSDFKKYFKDLPPEERLIVDYSCALQKDILVQGRMYVSQSYISFHANIFGWETLNCIRLKDVTSITKEKTALVIPNAIQICTESDRFFFASFVGRDSSFMMLFKLWQKNLVLPETETMPIKEVWELVHSCYGEVGSEEEDEDYLTAVTPISQTSSIPSILLSSTGGSASEDDNKNDKSIGIDEIERLSQISGDDGLPRSQTSTLKAAVVVNGHSSGVAETDSSDSEGEILVPVDELYLEVPVCPVNHSQGVVVADATIPCDVDQLFTMLFTKSKFYWDFHTKRKTFNIVQGDWEQNLGESKKVRQVSFTVTLNNAMGPKHSQVTETQVLLPESKPGLLYAIDAESVNAGIPYEDSFYVTCHFCISRISAHESKLVIVSQVKYKKSVSWMIKPFIEKNSWAGIKEFYTHLEQAIKEECVKATVLSHSPTPSSVRLGGPAIVRRKKRNAPAPPCAAVNAIDKESIPVNGIPSSREDDSVISQISANSPLIFKATLCILGLLLLLNAYLFVKLIRLETAANAPTIFQTTPSFTEELPQNHQEWLLLLQRQEALHKLELQKWHEVLMAALQVLHQAELDLELLTFKISNYSEGKMSIFGLKAKAESINAKSPPDGGEAKADEQKPEFPNVRAEGSGEIPRDESINVRDDL